MINLEPHSIHYKTPYSFLPASFFQIYTFHFSLRRVFPNSLFTRVTVNNHTVHMIAGLRKHKSSPQDNALLTQTGEPNNTIKLASIPGSSTLVATVGRGITSVSGPKLNAPSSLQLSSNKTNFGVHSPLAITNKASGVLRLNSTLGPISRTLAPAPVTLTNQIASLGHMTTTTTLTGRSDLNSNESRSSSPNPSSNMTTTLQLVSTPTMSTSLLPTLANTSTTQGSVTGRSSPNPITAQTLTRASSPASSTFSLASLYPLSRSSSPIGQPQGTANSSSRASTPVSLFGESETSTPARSLTAPAMNPLSTPTVGGVALASLSASRSRSTSPASVVSSDGKQATQGLRREDAGQLTSGVPIRLVDEHVGINCGMASQDGGRFVSEAHVRENEKLLEPEPKRNKLDTTLGDNDTRVQVVNTERIHLGVQSDLTQRMATVSKSGVAVESTSTPSLTTPVVTVAAIADEGMATTFTAKRTDNTCVTASSQTSRTGLALSDQCVVTHPQTSTNHTSQVAATGRLNTLTTHPTPHNPTTNANQTSFISSSGHLNTTTNAPTPHHLSSSTTNTTATSTLHTPHDSPLPSTAKLNTTMTLPTPHDSSLVMASKPLSVCTSGSQTDIMVTATVPHMAADRASQLMTSSNTCSGTSTDSDRGTVPRPLSGESESSQYVCSWDSCTR